MLWFGVALDEAGGERRGAKDVVRARKVSMVGVPAGRAISMLWAPRRFTRREALSRLAGVNRWVCLHACRTVLSRGWRGRVHVDTWGWGVTVARHRVLVGA